MALNVGGRNIWARDVEAEISRQAPVRPGSCVLVDLVVDGGTSLKLDHCVFTRGAPMTGSGKIDDDAGTFRLTVDLGGRNRLTYYDDADGVTSVKGRYRGDKVNLKR